jgi:hypothetical protein
MKKAILIRVFILAGLTSLVSLIHWDAEAVHFYDVWGSPDSNITFAVGYGGTILVYPGIGTSWYSMESGTTEDLFGVWGSSATRIFSVGLWDTILINNVNPTAYIYSTDSSSAHSYKSFLDFNWYLTTLFPLSQVANTDFSKYDVIIAGNDTGEMGNWGNTSSINAVGDSAKPVIGIGEGGASLFQELGLSINWGNGWIDIEKTDIRVVDPDSPMKMEA